MDREADTDLVKKQGIESKTKTERQTDKQKRWSLTERQKQK